MTLYLGLDLGQAAELTALAALESRDGPDPQRPGQPITSYACRWLRRWPLGTKYPAIVAEVAELTRKVPSTSAMLGVDQTGVGAAVVGLFAQAGLDADLRPVLLTAGHVVSSAGGVLQVPKQELASTLLALLQAGRLKIAPDLGHAETLSKEILRFRPKVTLAGGQETFDAWRERAHDDLVLALGIAAFLAEREAEPPGAGTAEGLFSFGGPPQLPRGCSGRASDPRYDRPDPVRGF